MIILTNVCVEMQRLHRPSRFLVILLSTTTFLLLLLFLLPDSRWDDTLTRSAHHDPSKPLFPSDYYKSLSRPSFCDSITAENKPIDLRDHTLARPLSPTELMCRPFQTNQTAIPRYLHQSWKTKDLPDKFQKWSRGCREQHREWEWVLWTDDDNLKLVQSFFPDLEETYHALPHNIYRADLSRNLYMYMFGGVYTDLDMDCLRPTEAVLDPSVLDPAEITGLDSSHGLAIFARMGTDASFQHSIPNAWMASSPFHPFFLLPITFTYRTYKRMLSPIYCLFHFWPGAEYLTGPVALRRNIKEYEPSEEDDGRVVVLPEKWVYPYDWKASSRNKSVWNLCSAQSKEFDQDACKDLFKTEERGSIAITYWSHSWGS